MNHRLILPLAALLLLAPAVAADHHYVVFEVTEGPYGEPCTGLYVLEAMVFVVCAGKGITTNDPTDCVVYVNVVGMGECVPVRFIEP